MSHLASKGLDPLSPPLFARMATAVRALAMDAVEKAQSGHPGMPLGMADVATVLVSEFLKFLPQRPLWPDRDRLVLSAGHGSMLLYALNYLTGYEGMTLDELQRFRQWRSHTAGHPELNPLLGIETTTGPLGQGLGNAVGMALAERILNARYGSEMVDHRTYAIVGDGCLMEGISHEALSLAGHLKLHKLTVLFDDNQITIDGPTSLSVSEDHLARFQAYGWHVQRLNGHDPGEIRQALTKAHEVEDRPSMIACRTTIGFGAPSKAGKASAHGAPLGPEEIAGARQTLDWPHPPFDVPSDILAAWRQVGRKHEITYQAWEDRLAQSNERQRFLAEYQGDLPEGWDRPLQALKEKFLTEQPKVATRQSSGHVVDCLISSVPTLVGGSADLTGSTNTKPKESTIIQPPDYRGRYIHYGVREHGMAAAMNGLALHGGVIPYGGTFLVFSDYCRPAIRLAALMHQRVIFILTHDSIGLGEDGPTHQPVEHLAALRAIPNLQVFRPADGVEVIEAWKVALETKTGPSVIALSRQAVPTVRAHLTTGSPETNLQTNWVAQGGYVLIEQEKAAVTLMATGSEVALALEVHRKLAEENIRSRVVSLPCRELLDQQPTIQRDQILGVGTLRVAIEAGVSQGWDRYVGSDGLIIGVDRFGASAPYEEIYHHLGLEPQTIVGKIMDKIKAKQAQKKGRHHDTENCH